MRHVWIAGAEDSIWIHIDVDFFLHRRLDVDFGQHAETVRAERGAGTRIDIFEVARFDQAVNGITHGFLSLPGMDEVAA